MTYDADNDGGLQQAQTSPEQAHVRATCPRCGIDGTFKMDAPFDINPLTVQMLAPALGCPRAPRICGTLKLEEA